MLTTEDDSYITCIYSIPVVSQSVSQLSITFFVVVLRLNQFWRLKRFFGIASVYHVFVRVIDHGKGWIVANHSRVWTINDKEQDETSMLWSTFVATRSSKLIKGSFDSLFAISQDKAYIRNSVLIRDWRTENRVPPKAAHGLPPLVGLKKLSKLAWSCAFLAQLLWLWFQPQYVWTFT